MIYFRCWFFVGVVLNGWAEIGASLSGGGGVVVLLHQHKPNMIHLSNHHGNGLVMVAMVVVVAVIKLQVTNWKFGEHKW